MSKSDEQLLVELLQTEPEFLGYDFEAEPHEQFVDDDALRGLGYPVVALFGASPPQVEDPAADVHAAAVHNLSELRTSRFLRTLPGLDRKVLTLLYGLGCEPHSPEAVAAQVGATCAHVIRVERSAPTWLRDQFELPDRA